MAAGAAMHGSGRRRVSPGRACLIGDGAGFWLTPSKAGKIFCLPALPLTPTWLQVVMVQLWIPSTRLVDGLRMTESRFGNKERRAAAPLGPSERNAYE
jgi:hypothetical protein